MYAEACQLSAKLRNAKRPQRPLKIIIAGAGNFFLFIFPYRSQSLGPVQVMPASYIFMDNFTCLVELNACTRLL